MKYLFALILDSLSCTPASSLESPDTNSRVPFVMSSTPRLLGESPVARDASATPKNSRHILEKWLKSTPSPRAVLSDSFDSKLRQRNALTEQTNSHAPLPESTPKRKTVLVVRPSSEPKGPKRHRGASLQLIKSSTKRKLVSEDKENPPSKTIKMCFTSTKTPKSNETKYDSDKSKDEQQSTSTRIRRPFVSNRARDILDYVDEHEEEDKTTDNESSS